MKVETRLSWRHIYIVRSFSSERIEDKKIERIDRFESMDSKQYRKAICEKEGYEKGKKWIMAGGGRSVEGTGEDDRVHVEFRKRKEYGHGLYYIRIVKQCEFRETKKRGDKRLQNKIVECGVVLFELYSDSICQLGC